MLSFFPRDVLDGIFNLIESVSEGFPTYSFSINESPPKSYSSLPIFAGSVSQFLHFGLKILYAGTCLIVCMARVDRKLSETDSIRSQISFKTSHGKKDSTSSAIAR